MRTKHYDVVRISNHLKKHKISIKSLSSITSINESKLKRILSGRQSLTLEDRDAIYSALGFPEHPFIGLSDEVVLALTVLINRIRKGA